MDTIAVDPLNVSEHTVIHTWILLICNDEMCWAIDHPASGGKCIEFIHPFIASFCSNLRVTYPGSTIQPTRPYPRGWRSPARAGYRDTMPIFRQDAR